LPRGRIAFLRQRARASLAGATWLGVALGLGAGCSSPAARLDLEVIHRVPVHVLTVDDLIERVRRSPSELGVQTGGVRVVGVLSRRAMPCDPAYPTSCAQGIEGKHRFRASHDPAAAQVSVVLSGLQFELVEGETYVLEGTVDVALDVPERWILRAEVLAAVR